MAIGDFQSIKWASFVENSLVEQSVAAFVTSQAYQSEVAGAKQININLIDDVNVLDYTADTDITTQSLADTQVSLALDQDKYFSFTADDSQLAQSQADFMNPAMQKAALQLALTADTYVFGSNTYGDANIPAGNKLGSIGSSIAINSANVEEYLFSMAEILRSNHVPRGEGFLVVPPWFVTKLNLAGIGKGSDSVATEMSVNGFVTRYSGLNIVESTQVAAAGGSSDEYQILAFSSRAIPMGSLINEMEILRNPARFGNIVRGHFLFGAKPLFAEEIAVLSAEKAAEA